MICHVREFRPPAARARSGIFAPTQEYGVGHCDIHKREQPRVLLFIIWRVDGRRPAARGWTEFHSNSANYLVVEARRCSNFRGSVICPVDADESLVDRAFAKPGGKGTHELWRDAAAAHIAQCRQVFRIVTRRLSEFEAIGDAEPLGFSVEGAMESLAGIIRIDAVFAAVFLRRIAHAFSTRIASSVGKNGLCDVTPKCICRVCGIADAAEREIEKELLTRKQRRKRLMSRTCNREVFRRPETCASCAAGGWWSRWRRQIPWQI